MKPRLVTRNTPAYVFTVLLLLLRLFCCYCSLRSGRLQGLQGIGWNMPDQVDHAISGRLCNMRFDCVKLKYTRASRQAKRNSRKGTGGRPQGDWRETARGLETQDNAHRHDTPASERASERGGGIAEISRFFSAASCAATCGTV